MTMERVAQVRAQLEAGQAFLVTSVPNRFYYTGFETSAGSVFITKDEAVFLIDFRYFEKAKETVKSCRVRKVWR